MVARDIPEMLLSGNHGEIERWRRKESLKRTFQRRPDLLEAIELTDDEKEFLQGLS